MLHFNKLNKKQVEAQGVKKLDSFKGFQELNVQELQEIEGGKGIRFELTLFGFLILGYSKKDGWETDLW